MTDEDQEYVRTTHRMPKQLREDAQDVTGHGELSEAVRLLYRAVAYGENITDAARFAAESVRVDREIERAERQIQDAQDRLADLRERQERINELRDEGQDRKADYEDAIVQIEQDVRDGMAVDPGHGAIQQAASVAGVKPEDVIEDLKARNPDLPERAFRDQRKVEIEWKGTRDEA